MTETKAQCPCGRCEAKRTGECVDDTMETALRQVARSLLVRGAHMLRLAPYDDAEGWTLECYVHGVRFVVDQERGERIPEGWRVVTRVNGDTFHGDALLESDDLARMIEATALKEGGA